MHHDIVDTDGAGDDVSADDDDGFPFCQTSLGQHMLFLCFKFSSMVKFIGYYLHLCSRNSERIFYWPEFIILRIITQ